MASIMRRQGAKRAPTARRSLIASSVDVDLATRNWGVPKPQTPWQREVYRFLDLIGELRYIAGEFGSAVSRTRLYLAILDDSGDISAEIPTDATGDDAKALGIFRRCLGTRQRGREEMKLLGMNVFLAGEAYLAGLAAEGSVPDRWVALSINDLSRSGGDVFVDLGEGKRRLVQGRDVLTRVWNPHPNRRAQADSSVRSNRAVLRLLELLLEYLFAQIDSRLKSGGILPWPSGTAPVGAEGTVADDLMAKMIEVAAESAKDKGTAANVVPLVVEVPTEALGKIGMINMQTELSKQAKELIDGAIARLAQGLDIDPAELTGLSGANHWSSYSIKQSTVDSQVTPIVACICDAIERAWLRPALEAADLDPDHYAIWYDTSTLTVRPQRLKDTLDLYAQGLVNAQAVLTAGAYLDGEGLTTEEEVRRYIRDLVLRDPTLFSSPAIRHLIGITDDMLPKGMEFAATPSATPPPPPPVPEQVPGKHQLPEIPQTQGKEPKQPVSPSITASASPLAVERAVTNATTLALADATALRALELAGGRLLGPRERGAHTDVPRHELHTVVAVREDRIPDLLRGAGEHTAALARQHGIVDVDGFCATVAGYCAMVLRDQVPHDRDRLLATLTLAGLVDGGPDAS